MALRKKYVGTINSLTAERLADLETSGRIHSIFRHTLNIELNATIPNLITLGDHSILAAPNSIAIANFADILANVTLGDECQIAGQQIVLAGNLLLQWQVLDDPKTKELLLTPKLPTRSFQYLQDFILKNNPYSDLAAYQPFYLQLSKEGEALSQAIVQENRQEIMRQLQRIIGLGVGLTPSGDDYLTGLLLTLRHWPQYYGVLEGVFLQNPHYMEETNLISQHQLYFAILGESKAVVINLIRGLLEDNLSVESLQAAFNAVLEIGSTSGYDILLGINAAMNIIIRIEENNGTISSKNH